MDKWSKLQLLSITLLSCLATQVYAQHSWYPMLQPSFDIGIMAGYTGGPRRGVIMNPVTSGSAVESGAQDNTEIGAQMRLLFGSEYKIRPFLYANGARPIGVPLSIRYGKILSPFTQSTKQTLQTNWLARVGAGVSSYWLYDVFQLGIGAGAVALNQTFKTYAGEATTTTYSQNKTSVRPSVMGNVTWSLCSQYFRGHEAFITAQLTADSQPVINDNFSSAGTALNTNVNQAWVPRGDLIFSIKLG